MIDHTRIEAGTPVNAANQLLGMMSEHLAALSGHMAQLREQTQAFSALVPPAIYE